MSKLNRAYSTTEEMIPPARFTPVIPSIVEPVTETADLYSGEIYWNGGSEKED